MARTNNIRELEWFDVGKYEEVSDWDDATLFLATDREEKSAYDCMRQISRAGQYPRRPAPCDSLRAGFCY